MGDAGDRDFLFPNVSSVNCNLRYAGSVEPDLDTQFDFQYFFFTPVSGLAVFYTGGVVDIYIGTQGRYGQSFITVIAVIAAIFIDDGCLCSQLVFL